ncbi:maltokinase N-terminal cap-like domain-containing protein [Nocardioides montaniterrae]
MAILHVGSTITPTKPELLAMRFGGEVELIGSYRLDDPEGEVGIEGFVVRYDGRTRHLVMTYRGAPLDDAALISTMDHTELGERWVYDGSTDPVALAVFTRALKGEQEQAVLELWEDHQLVGVREPAVQLTALTVDVPAEAALTIYDDLDAAPETDGARLEAAWDGGHGLLATLG